MGLPWIICIKEKEKRRHPYVGVNIPILLKKDNSTQKSPTLST